MAGYGRVLFAPFAPRASAPWVRGRELGFETWERTNTGIYKNGICPKIYTAGFFRLKKCTRSIPPNLNSFSGKNTKNAWKWRNLHCWQKFYTWQNGYFCQQICSKFNDLFMIEWLVSGSRQEMGKSTFGLALSAQLIDLPLLPKVQWHLVEKARFRLYFHWFGNYS